MRGRVIAAFLILLSLSPAAFPQCSWTPRFSGQFRTTVYDLDVDGTFLWTATGYGVQLLDRNSAAPEPLDSLPLAGSTRVIATNGNGIAYAGSGSQIQVIRRNGKKLELIRSVDAGAAINDMVVTTALFVATKNGIAHFNLFDVTNPARSSVSMFSTKPNVTSLALAGTTLYAADGDPTVETYTITVPTLPQRTGSLESLSRSASVHAALGFVFVSDDLGQSTDVFSGTTRLARLAYGSTSLAATASGAYFVAGPDRTLRAIDISQLSRPAELFELQLAPTGGTSNGIFAMERAGNSVYVAAGDIGLVTLDVTPLAPPYPLVSYADGATTSALLTGDKAYFSKAAAIAETSPALAPLRSFPQGGATLEDARGNELLISSGATTSLLTEGQKSYTATFKTTVASAVISDQIITALLGDGTVWRVATVTDATPQQVDVGGKSDYLERSGSNIAVGQINAGGDTVIRYYTNNSITTPSRTVTIKGAAIGGLALSATQAAVFTFSGISVVDLATGNVSVLPGSNNILPRQLVFSGSDLLVLGDRTLLVWNTVQKTLVREHTLPANAVSMHAASQRAVIATTEGMISISYLQDQPGFAADPPVNRYFSKAVAAEDRLYLFGDSGVDFYSTAIGVAPRFVAGVRNTGIIDIAATNSRLFTLSSNGTVTAYSSEAGAELAKATLGEGQDFQPLGLFTAGNAVWMAYSKGCISGGCEQKTLVLDPATLAVTATLGGGATDVAVSGTRAYALFDLPNEVRVFNIADPLHPSQLAFVGRPTGATSIAAASGKVYVLGDKLYTYSEAALLLEGERFTAVNAPSQQLRISGNCAVITGRSAAAELYALPAWTAGTPSDMPSTVRSTALSANGLYLLTEHSIEVWTTTAPTAPPKRRATR